MLRVSLSAGGVIRLLTKPFLTSELRPMETSLPGVQLKVGQVTGQLEGLRRRRPGRGSPGSHVGSGPAPRKNKSGSSRGRGGWQGTVNAEETRRRKKKRRKSCGRRTTYPSFGGKRHPTGGGDPGGAREINYGLSYLPFFSLIYLSQARLILLPASTSTRRRLAAKPCCVASGDGRSKRTLL
ncbi:hypothetical protein THAOC_10560 [Thalassiosira oceanica]|uniref:Uncharacterized protein n=1 Tax=Thalassiosira oceanica TaxID=159749 RepID=K0SSB3_THAOC|nr:hypothetical protein THAOC_10560 [Thalassiosira oceanica]|eukprot:EJK68275.1 hypothetical protein THAOC_10560 [Thalassiosira oceanica]